MTGDRTPSTTDRFSLTADRCRWCFSPINAIISAAFALLALCSEAYSAQETEAGNLVSAAAPNREMSATLFPNAAGPLEVTRQDGHPPVWRISAQGRLVGYIASTYEVSNSVGYSGRPLDVLIGISPEAVITNAALVGHSEPILTLGISSQDIARYVQAFAGYDLKAAKVEAFKDSSALPPIIARATVTTGVIRDAILRTARTVALGHGLIATQSASIDRVTFAQRTWMQLASEGAISHATMDLAEAARSFGPITNPLPTGTAPFIDLWVAVLDPPTIGQNLLGQQTYTRATASLSNGDAAILIAGTGLHSYRGTNYQTSGVFDRIEIIQGSNTIRLRKEDYLRIDKLALADAPAFKEFSVFRLAASTGFRASEPFRVEISAEREREDGSLASIRLPLGYALPKAYIIQGSATAASADTPLWIAAWQRKPVTIALTGLMILLVAAALFAQEWFVRRPALWLWSRTGFLLTTLIFLGWYANGQLSVVQIIAFFHSLLNGFRWETFLIEPVIFVLWCFVALGLLFWGRGVYCGWLCPFGALQELLNEGAKRLGVRQIDVPFAVQERLWAIKYTLFMAILGLSFYSMDQALVLAEAEPFKTAISMRFMRAWPFVLFVIALLTAGLFIERFYCRYLCPLGAALAIPAKIKLFDWLHRRPQCGRECRLCETQCTVGAIDTLGRINPNECVLCLRCQVTLNDGAQCIALKRRAARSSESASRVDPSEKPSER